jgi:hypothetical protein
MLKYLNTDPPQFERNSQKMTQLARNYHEKPQTKDLCTDDSLAAARALAYDNITTTTSPEDQRNLAALISEVEVAAAL